MKRNLFIIMITTGLMGAMLLTGCSGGDAGGDKEKIAASEADTEEMSEEETKDEEAADTASDTAADLSDNMSDTEKKDVQDKLNSIGYYGFLRSEYSDPADIEWEEVFYVGAGLDKDNGSPSKEVIDAYLKATGDDELYTDLTAVSGEDVKSYVKATTGLDYSKMNHPLDWVYLEDYDLYVCEHGDTNQSNSEILSGHYEDGVYTISYRRENEDYVVTFADDGDTYRFISNVSK